MKSLRVILFLVAATVLGGDVFAQQLLGPEWGENATQEERRDNALRFNYYRDAYNSQRYDDALGYLPELIANSPKGAQNIYVYAINIYKIKIQRSMKLDERKMYVDSLLNLYDMRIQYFGDDARFGRPYILVQKAKDYLSFMPSDREGVRQYFEEAIDANQNTPDPDFINLYFNELTTDYKSDLVETDYYMDQYERLAELMAGITDPSADTAKATFDALFVSSGAANCENLERIFKARVEANPDDVATLAKAFNLLVRSECETPFLMEVGELYYNAEPTATTARNLASAYVKIGETEKALSFLKAALDKETDPIAKAMLAVEIAGTELTLKNAAAAANYAKQACQFNPENGYAYMMLAQAYAAGAQACEGFDSQTVYWLAYDQMATARRYFDASAPEMEQIDKSMLLFRRSFPKKEELFFRGITSDGVAYDVKCGWISGRTTVKMID